MNANADIRESPRGCDIGCEIRVLSNAAFEFAEALLPLGLGFAAGAMLYVVADELIPESHARGNERIASGALLGGFALMMLLDNAFG